ncbi:hypothetical protein HaLaN_22103, partial [Haematococcus lacustris]
RSQSIAVTTAGGSNAAPTTQPRCHEGVTSYVAIVKNEEPHTPDATPLMEDQLLAASVQPSLAQTLAMTQPRSTVVCPQCYGAARA